MILYFQVIVKCRLANSNSQVPSTQKAQIKLMKSLRPLMLIYTISLCIIPAVRVLIIEAKLTDTLAAQLLNYSNRYLIVDRIIQPIVIVWRSSELKQSARILFGIKPKMTSIGRTFDINDDRIFRKTCQVDYRETTNIRNQ